MKKFSRLPFPKYLNRKRLIIYFELDEVIVSSIAGASVFLISFMLAIPPWVSIAFVALTMWLTIKMYKKFKRTTAKGYIDHLFYTAGYKEIKNSYPNKKCNFSIPYGFIKRFRN